MAQTKIIGGGVGPAVISPGVEQAVDPTFLAARIALRPLDYTGQGALLGHYATAQKSGNFTAWAANDFAGSIRWAPSLSTSYLVLMRLKWGMVTQATATAGVYDVGAFIARAFTVDFTVGTAVNMASVVKTNTMRASMSNSQMGTAGPRIATTLTMSGQTIGAIDNNAVAFGLSNLTGTTVGIASSPQTMYEYTSLSQHPIVLSSQEGIVLRMLTASAGGTYNVYTQWEWAEVLVY